MQGVPWAQRQLDERACLLELATEKADKMRT